MKPKYIAVNLDTKLCGLGSTPNKAINNMIDGWSEEEEGMVVVYELGKEFVTKQKRIYEISMGR